MVTYKMGEPMTWTEFRSMPKERKAEYLAGLRDKYRANASAVCQMFGVTPSYFSNYMKSEGMESGFTGHRMTEAEKEAFLEFAAGSTAERMESNTTGEDDSVAGDAVDAANGAHRPQSVMDRLSIRFTGDVRLSEVYNSLRTILGDSARGTLEITWHLSGLESKDI